MIQSSYFECTTLQIADAKKPPSAPPGKSRGPQNQVRATCAVALEGFYWFGGLVINVPRSKRCAGTARVILFLCGERQVCVIIGVDAGRFLRPGPGIGESAARPERADRAAVVANHIGLAHWRSARGAHRKAASFGGRHLRKSRHPRKIPTHLDRGVRSEAVFRGRTTGGHFAAAGVDRARLATAASPVGRRTRPLRGSPHGRLG